MLAMYRRTLSLFANDSFQSHNQPETKPPNEYTSSVGSEL